MGYGLDPNTIKYCYVVRAAEGQEEVTFRQYHEEVLCVRRLVPCDNKCGEWVAFEKLEQHLQTACVKRQLPPLACRLGCGLVFRGKQE